MRLVIILALVALVLAIWLRKRGSAPAQGPPKREKPKQIERGEYDSVSVHPGPGACDSVRDLVGERFLVDEAPRFPLPGCDVDNCQCSYRQEGDRRQENRRRSDDGLPEIDIVQGPEEEKRTKTDRRRQ